MLIIDNREEIKQYLLNETGSPEGTEEILAFLETPTCLSPIYDIYENKNVFRDDKPHSLEEVEIMNKMIAELCGIEIESSPCSNENVLNFQVIKTGASLADLVEQIAAIITVGDFAYKIIKQNQGAISNFIQTNVSKDNIESKIKELLNKAIMKIKIKEISEEDEKTTEG